MQRSEMVIIACCSLWPDCGLIVVRVVVVVQDLICRLLQPDPDKRLTAREALRHPWLRKPAVSDRPLSDCLP